MTVSLERSALPKISPYPTWRDYFPNLEAAYDAMAADEERECEAQEWCNAYMTDLEP